MTCQSCQSPGPTDIHHKTRRWKLGKEADKPEHQIKLCRKCHTRLHSQRRFEDYIRLDPANMENGAMVEWKDKTLFQEFFKA